LNPFFSSLCFTWLASFANRAEEQRAIFIVDIPENQQIHQKRGQKLFCLRIDLVNILLFTDDHKDIRVFNHVIGARHHFDFVREHLLHGNVERVTAVGTFNSMMGLAGVFGPVLGGAVSQWGFPTLMLYAAGMTLLGFAVLKIKI
jgi:hypothetical protein